MKRQSAIALLALGLGGSWLGIRGSLGDPSKDITELERVKFVTKGGQVFRNDFKGSGANLSRK